MSVQNQVQQPSRNVFLWAVFIVPVLVLMAPQSRLKAQGILRSSSLIQQARFIDPPRSVQQKFREAERAIDEDRLSDAVVALGDLLQREGADVMGDTLSGQDFFLPSRNSTLRSDSNLQRVRRMIGELPADALETYALRYGPLARKTLTEAAAVRDWHAVADVRRKFFHTKAGYDASLLLAQREILQGRPLAASLLLDDVATLPRAVEYLGKTVTLMHAAALKMSGRPVAEAKVQSGEDVTIGGKKEAWPTEAEVAGWIGKRYSASQTRAGGESSDYKMFGGRADRNENSAGQMPLENVRWKLETTATPREARILEKFAGNLLTNSKLPPPSVTPLRIGDQLLMRTTNCVFGVDYRTGKRVWNYPWSAAESFEPDSAPAASVGHQNANNFLTQRVWNDLPYGQITSDGRRVFMVENLGEVEAATISPIMGLRGVRPGDNTTSTLVALDLPTEGKIIWRLGGGSDEPNSLSDAFFLGPPLPLDGRLYCLVEIAGDISLVCLDPKTGDEFWRQQLVAVASTSVNVDVMRRISGATPSYSNGLLICPTGAGAIVAVDLIDRQLRWGATYPRSTKVTQTTTRSRTGLVDPTRLMQRWHNGTAIIQDQSLYITPTESDSLMCLDLVSGQQRFNPRERGDMRYMAGIRNGRIYLVGTRKMIAVDASTGRQITNWNTAPDMLASGQQIVGRGVFGQNDYFLPTSANNTSSNELVRISLEDASVVERRKTRYRLGNLIATDGDVISQGPTTLAVAFGEQSLEPNVDARLLMNPDDFDALVRKSELLIQREKRREALALLERAHKIKADGVEVRMLSVAAMLGLLREDPDDQEELAQKLKLMIDRSSDRVEFLSLRVKSALKRKSTEQATDAIIELSQELVSSGALAETTGGAIIRDSARQCEADAWLAARVAEVRKMADAEEVASINQRITNAVRPKLEGSRNILSQVIHHFGSFDVQAARQRLGQHFARENSHLQLERLAIGPEFTGMRAIGDLSPARMLMLTRAFADGGLNLDGILAVDSLRKLSGDDVSEATIDELEAKSKRNTGKPTWATEAALDWNSSPGMQRGIQMISSARRLLRTTRQWGETFQGWQLVSEGTAVQMRDPTGRLVHLSSGSIARREEPDRDAYLAGGVMIVSKPTGEISAVDLYKVRVNQGGSDAILWTRNFSGDGSPLAMRRSGSSLFGDSMYRDLLKSVQTPGQFRVGGIMGDRFMVGVGGDLMAIDLASSKTIWRNSTAPRSGAILTDGKQIAVVSSAASDKRVVLYDAMDGEKTSETPWTEGEVWATSGRHVLCYAASKEPNIYDVRVVDVFTDEVKLTMKTPVMNRASKFRAYGQILNGRYMVILDTKGNLTIWDVREAKALAKEETAAYEKLLGIHAMEMDGQIIVFPSRDANTQVLDGSRRTVTQTGTSFQTVSALYAISLEDGSMRWKREFESAWGCTLAQPSASPIMLLTRNTSQYNSTGPRTVKMDALAIDVRDGKTIHKRMGTEVSSRVNDLAAKILVQTEQNRVRAVIGGEELTYKFGEKDPEPAPKPPANADQKNKDKAPAKAKDELDDLFG